MVRQGAVRCLTGVLAVAALATWMLACATGREPEEATRLRPQAAATAPTARPSLLDQVQGKWVGGIAQNEAERWEWTIQGDKLASKTGAGDYYNGTVKFDEQASPIRVDIKLTDCSDSNLNGAVVQGIAKLEGNKLTFCVKSPDDGIGYPTTFDGSQGMVIVGQKQ